MTKGNTALSPPQSHPLSFPTTEPLSVPPGRTKSVCPGQSGFWCHRPHYTIWVFVTWNTKLQDLWSCIFFFTGFNIKKNYILNLTYLVKIRSCETGNYLTVPISLSGLRMCEVLPTAVSSSSQVTIKIKNCLSFFSFPLVCKETEGDSSIVIIAWVRPN